MNTNTPFPASYWVKPGLFLAGQYPGDVDSSRAKHKLQALYDAGIRCIISLMEEEEIFHYGLPMEPYWMYFESLANGSGQAVSFYRFAIRDASIPSRRMMIDILDTIDACLGQGMPVYIHCFGGIGRTGTVVGCHLARHGLASGEDVLPALAELRQQVRPYWPSPEYPQQVEMVVNWRERTSPR